MTDPSSPSRASSLSPAEGRAAEQLWREHQPWLLGALQRRLRNLAEAQDVTSETFSRVMGYRRLHAMDEPRAYLASVAKSVLVQAWRRRDLERAYLDALAAHPQAAAPSAEERAVLIESLERVAQALEGLPPKARQAFLMSQLDGMTYADIAARLGVSASMVRRYMAQGLRQCLAALPG